MDQIARADNCPALSPPQSHRSWNLLWLLAAIIAAQFLPDRHYSWFSLIPFIAVAIVTASTGLLMRSHVRSREPTLAWNVVRWYAVLSFTLSAYVVGMRLALPIQPWAGAFNSVLQHRLNYFTSFPLLALCLAPSEVGFQLNETPLSALIDANGEKYNNPKNAFVNLLNGLATSL